MAKSNPRQFLERVVVLANTKANHDLYTGLLGELALDDENIDLYVHDGLTVGGFKLQEFLKKTVAVTATPYTVIDLDKYIGVNVTSTVTVNLPAGKNGRELFIKDESGDAGTNNINIIPNGTETIDSGTTVAIDTTNEKLALIDMGNIWMDALPISSNGLGIADKQHLLWEYPVLGGTTAISTNFGSLHIIFRGANWWVV